MKLTYKTVNTILQAHNVIDGNIVTTEGAGEVRIKVAHNLKQLREAAQLALDTRKKVFKEIAGGDSIAPDEEEKKQQIGMRMEEIDNTEVELKLWRIPYDRLESDKLSPAVIAGLEGLISGLPDLGEPDA